MQKPEQLHKSLRVVARLLPVHLVLVAGMLQGQALSPRFERLSVEHGLSFNQVNSILQDSRGFMWFGTMNGLNKYDGYKFTVYNLVPGDTNSLPARLVNLMHEDANGDIWTGGIGRLARYDRKNDRFIRCLPDQVLNSWSEEHATRFHTGGMWFATNGGGLYRYDGSTGTFSHFRHNPLDSHCITSDTLTCVMVDRTDVLWIGGTRGLTSLDRTRRKFRHYAQGPKTRVWELYEDPDTSRGQVWIGAEDGLYLFDRKKDSLSRFTNEFGARSNDIRTIYRDSKGRIWVGMMSGIAMFDLSTGRFTGYQDELGANDWGGVRAWHFQEDGKSTMYLCGNISRLRIFDEATHRWRFITTSMDHEPDFLTMVSDNAGTLWFGTLMDGVLKVDPARKPFTMYKHVPGDPASMSSSLATGISQDSAANVWVGTHAGLDRLDAATGKFTHFRHDARNRRSLSHDFIWPVLENSRGALWVGTRDGLDRLDRTKGTFEHFLQGMWVTSLFQDKHDTLWVGIIDGRLAQYHHSSPTFRFHPPRYTRPAFEVHAMTEDREGLLWLGVALAGLTTYNRRTNEWSQYDADPDSPNGKKTVGAFGALALLVDHHGTLWVSSGGLLKYDKLSDTFTTYAPNERISGILEDDKGNLWLSTTGGVLRFNPQSEQLTRYGPDEGADLGSWSGPTGYRSRAGEMFFGGSNGLLRFHPDSVRDNTFVPPIVITRFSKFNRPVQLDTTISEKKAIELSYKDNMITFEFAALNFTSPAKNQYAYQMAGFDTGWVYCGTERKATYTNLDGGHYVFKVKGSNNDGVWNEAGTSIAVIITPPLWATWWFRGFAFMTLLITVGGTIRYVEKRKLMRRIEQLEQEGALERERTRISQDMHDDVGARLTEIGILSEMVKKDIVGGGRAATHAQRISEASREVIANISEIIWAINPANDSVDDLAAYLRQYASRYLEPTSVKPRFDFPDEMPFHQLTAEQRRNVFLVVKEALNNVVKHSGATEVLTKLDFPVAGIGISIDDNGRGFDTAMPSRFGNGLRSMEKRMADIQGMFAVHSEPGKGTRIVLSIPMIRKQSHGTQS
jgi:signal transduction histidine kinase/ligand-binding sensor domain-containing protein